VAGGCTALGPPPAPEKPTQSFVARQYMTRGRAAWASGNVPNARFLIGKSVELDPANEDALALWLSHWPLDSLPPADTTRWVVRRKAEVVAAVAGGLLTVDEACQRYTLSLEEFTSWQRAVDRSGMPGLRVTRIKHYRDQYERQQRY